MVEKEQIDAFVGEIVRRYSPEQVILFGSQASGSPNNDSDVDLLVLMDYEGYSADIAAEILSSINPRFSCDLLVRRPAEVRSKIQARDFFLTDVMAQGIHLYGRGN